MKLKQFVSEICNISLFDGLTFGYGIYRLMILSLLERDQLNLIKL
jgi:hypothetical protein